MQITPILFKPFIKQNINNNYFSNLSFNAKIDKNNPNYKKWIDSGYQFYNNVKLKTSEKDILGAAFVKETKGFIEVIIIDDKFKNVGVAGAIIHDDSAEVYINNFYSSIIKKVGTTGYNNLFDYIRKNHPEIKKVKANITNDESFKFHTAYGFKIGEEEVEFNFNNYRINKYLEYPLK